MKHIALYLLIVMVSVGVVSAQSAGTGENRDYGMCIWAGLSVNEPAFTAGPNADAVFSFVLMNDCPGTVDADSAHWRLVVNGEELKDSDMIFGSGPGPADGWGPLHPGDSYRFTKSLPLSRYFTTPGIYKVFWRGNGFESPKVTIRVIGKAKLLPTR
jgi:hypothetical protein